MPQLRRTGKHIEASEGDRSAGAGEGRRPVGTEDGDRQARDSRRQLDEPRLVIEHDAPIDDR
mgnify:CR=1 FL=1